MMRKEVWTEEGMLCGLSRGRLSGLRRACRLRKGRWSNLPVHEVL